MWQSVPELFWLTDSVFAKNSLKGYLFLPLCRCSVFVVANLGKQTWAGHTGSKKTFFARKVSSEDQLGLQERDKVFLTFK